MRWTPGHSLRFLWSVLLLAGVWFVAGCEKTTRDTDIKIIRLSELRSLYDRAQRGDRDVLLLVDPRSETRHAQAHIEGSRNLRLPQVDPKKEPDPSIERYSNIVVYGDDPASPAARGMTKRLMAVGYRGVRWYAGGIKEWRSRGYDLAGTNPSGVSPESKPAEANAPAEPAPATKPEPVAPASSESPQEKPR